MASLYGGVPTELASDSPSVGLRHSPDRSTRSSTNRGQFHNRRPRASRYSTHTPTPRTPLLHALGQRAVIGHGRAVRVMSGCSGERRACWIPSKAGLLGLAGVLCQVEGHVDQ
jgi:hypothetical protein